MNELNELQNLCELYDEFIIAVQKFVKVGGRRNEKICVIYNEFIIKVRKCVEVRRCKDVT